MTRSRPSQIPPASLETPTPEPPRARPLAVDDPGWREAQRPTWAEIDLEALDHNLVVLRASLPGQALCAVVKADAYGHGLVQVARRLQSGPVQSLGVALAEEGFRLREAGVQTPILVLNAVYGRAHRDVVAAGLTPVVYDVEHLAAFARAARGQVVRAHLKVDTGMSRLGVPMEALDAFLDEARRWPEVQFAGLMTHLSSADSDPEVTHAQLRAFDRALALVRRYGHEPQMKHVANSAGALYYPAARLGMARIGLALYGVQPTSPDPPAPALGLRPVMRVRSELIAVKQLPAGARVGYNGTFVTTRPTRLGIVPIGYGDGLMWSASNRGQMLVRGRRVPIVGRISMDLTCLDVTEVCGCQTGDEAVLIGTQGRETLGAQALATWARTLSYEVLTSISSRVPRLYR